MPSGTGRHHYFRQIPGLDLAIDALYQEKSDYDKIARKVAPKIRSGQLRVLEAALNGSTSFTGLRVGGQSQADDSQTILRIKRLVVEIGALGPIDSGSNLLVINSQLIDFVNSDEDFVACSMTPLVSGLFVTPHVPAGGNDVRLDLFNATAGSISTDSTAKITVIALVY